MYGEADDRNQNTILTDKISPILSPYVKRSIDNYNESFCSTPECIERANIIKAKMNDSADYCDDFHNYVCGGFVNSMFIPDDKNIVDVFFSLEDKVIEQLNTIIKRPSQPDEPEVVKLLKKFYKICMNTDAIEELGEKPLFDYIEQLGGWPVLKKNNKWNETLFDWKKNIAQIFNNNYWSTNFFSFYLDVDIKNNTRQVITLSDYYPAISRDDLLKGLDNKSVKNYYNYMINMSVALGAEKKFAEKELKEAIEFEIKLTNLTRPDEDYRNQSLSYNPMKLGDLAKNYPYFPWKNFLNHELLHSNISVDDDEIIIVTNPDYFSKLGILIDSTPKKVQANFVIWKEIKSVAKLMNEKIRKVNENYVKITTGSITREPRWIECTNTVTDVFSIATNALYVREYFKQNSKNNIALMVKNIHSQFIKLLNSTSWMDKETKSKAINKAKKIKQLVAYPDELLNVFIMNDYYKVYKNFKINNNSYIDSWTSLNLLNIKVSWRQLRHKYDPNDWKSFLTASSAINAFYDSVANSIQLPAGILQGEFFSNKLPQYLNYGAIGTIIGHEIMHAFDDEGKQYDENGNVANWWSNSTNEEYKKKAQCIIDQYGNYTVEEINMNVNGINTQGENIADNGGIKAVYWAYNDWLKNNDNKFEKKLPGFNFSPRQMFWISYANTWCSKSRLESQKLDVKSDPHSPSEFRINGPLSNLEEFSIDFRCPKGSNMNPKKKCTMW